MSGLSAYRSVRLIGSALPAEAVMQAADGAMPGQSPRDYLLPHSLSLSAAAARAWEVLLPAYQAWRSELDVLGGSEAATGVTRDRWLLPLLYELGYGRPAVVSGGLTLPAGLGEVKPSQYPLSHQLAWGTEAGHTSAAVAIHLVGARVDLDHKTPGVTARAPHAMLQELLNRSKPHLWGILSNGRSLRLLRDASSLARQSYLEFDLDLIFENQLYSDFRLLFTVLHASRLAPRTTSEGERAAAVLRADDCWLEVWRTTAIESGARALNQLREGVAAAITALGTGFVVHPANAQLLRSLEQDPGAVTEVHRWLLRLAYRLIVLFVAEDRELLHPPDADPAATALYAEHFSTGRLRQMAATRQGTRHDDLWEAHKLVVRLLGTSGSDRLALPPLASWLFEDETVGLLATARLSNRYLLAAVRALSLLTDAHSGSARPVDYRNLDSEELGGVYEGLLAYLPRFDPQARTFVLEEAPGNERKKTGSYYTSSALISLVLDEALDPMIDNAMRSSQPASSLLGLTVCDPACGSGHFLVAAARRLARALAVVRSGDTEPAPVHVRSALREVTGRCIYGVDLNDMAIEIAKVALWLEGLEPGKPLAFLDSHLKVGNALLGVTPRLLRDNIPDEAFTPIHGDDKAFTARLKRRNAEERLSRDQASLFEIYDLNVSNAYLATRTRELEAGPTDNFAQVKERADAWRRLQTDPELARQRLLADAWCAAFTQEKRPDAGPGITYRTLQRLQDEPDSNLGIERTAIATQARQYRFFHWHLEFPGVFSVPDAGTADVNSTTGWQGGFDCMLGNPPWDTLSPDVKEFFSAYDAGIREMPKAQQERRAAELLEDIGIRTAWGRHQRELYASAHFLKRSGRYRMYAEGNLGKGDFNVYRSFVELSLRNAREGGRAGQIVPAALYQGANAGAIRAALLTDFPLTVLLGFFNRKKVWFPSIHGETRFCVYAARIGGEPTPFRAAFGLEYETALRAAQGEAATIDPATVRTLSPEELAISEGLVGEGAALTAALYRAFSLFGDGSRPEKRVYMREIDMGNDRDLFDEDRGFPLFEGRMLAPYDYRAKAWVSGRGRAAVWKDLPFGSSIKAIAPQWRVPPERVPDKVQPRRASYRIGFCDITSPQTELPLVAAILPPQTVSGHSVPTIQFDPDWWWSMPAWLAVAHSLPINYLARRRVSLHFSYTILDSLPFPVWSGPDDEHVRSLSPLASELALNGPEMDAYRQRLSALGLCAADQHIRADDERWRSTAAAALQAYVIHHVFALNSMQLRVLLTESGETWKGEKRRLGEPVTPALLARYVADGCPVDLSAWVDRVAPSATP